MQFIMIFHNFSNSAIALIKSYLCNRKQFVKIDSLGSDLQPISLGVPQGSILGPLLFFFDLVHASSAFNHVHLFYSKDILVLNHQSAMKMV